MPGISAKMSFLPGAKVDKGTPKLKVQTLSFHPKIEHNSLPVKVSETNRILAIANAELADALEVGDRIAAVDGVDLVGPLEYSNICNDKRSCEVTVERMEGGRDSERGRLTEGEELEVQMTRINGTFGAEMNMFGRITNVAPGGAAEKAGLKAWDRIKTVDDTLVFNTKDMGQFFASKDTVTVFAMRPPHDRAWCRPRPAFPGLSGSRAALPFTACALMCQVRGNCHAREQEGRLEVIQRLGASGVAQQIASLTTSMGMLPVYADC